MSTRCGTPDPTKMQEADAKIAELEDRNAELEACVQDLKEVLMQCRMYAGSMAQNIDKTLRLWP